MQAGVDGGFEFRLLGAFEIAVDGRPVDIGGAKQELLLAMLALDPVGPVGTDALAEELWGSSPPANLAGGVQNVVSRARRVLTAGGAGSVAITARGPGYVLELDGAGRDVDRYEALARQGHELAGTGDAAAAVDAFRAALRIWRGPVLAGLADRPFARAEAARLEGSRSAVTEALADTLLADGSAGEAVAVLEPLVAREAFRESAAERLMLALYRVGRQSDALQVYRVTRGGLREELGLEPGPALRRLEGQILTQSPELDGPALAVAAAPTAAGSAPDGSSAAHGIRAFLFTDIEASTRRWEGDQDAMAADLATHDGVLRAAVEAHSGRVLSHTGDGLCADFPTSTAALQAAVDGQRALSGQRWRALAALRVRMAVHAGAAQDRDGNYFGPTLNRAARLMSLAAGGQVLCSQTAADLASDRLPAEVALLDLGEHRFADLSRPERVFQVTHPELAGEFPALTSGAEHANNLPAGASRFLGRAAELAELEALLRAERLVTLWGPGGAGKTRLSLELGVRALPEFGDGVWFVELAPLDRGELVAPAVMSALGMLAGSTADPVAELCRYLTNRQALVILDNCEHVVAAVAELVHALLTHCAGVRMVASSRELLGTTGEHAWPIPSLSVPSDEADLAALAVSDAVTLFCDRARASHPGFALTQTNAAAVAEICRRLDGIPLALELASARVRVLGVKGLVARLDDRLDVLTGGSRTADARHQTLRAAVDWSYELMPTAERALLGRLSVFPGTFDLAAAEAVGRADEAQAGFEVLDLLARLVD